MMRKKLFQARVDLIQAIYFYIDDQYFPFTIYLELNFKSGEDVSFKTFDDEIREMLQIQFH